MLGARTEVTAPLFPQDEPPDVGVRCEALPFERVRVTPFIVTPTGPLDLAGPDFEPVWIACQLGPAEGLFACLKGALPLEWDDIPECPEPSFTDLDPNATGLPEYPSPCRFPADATTDGRLEFVAPFATNLLLGGDIELTMVSKSPGSPDTATCLEGLLSQAEDVPNDCIYAVQRISVGPIEKLLSFAGMFGFELPPELGEVPDPEDIPDGDRNPRIESFKVILVDVDGSETALGQQERGAKIQVELGQLLKIEADTPEVDLQTYPVAINAGAGGMGTESQTERLDGSWYRTWGRLQSGGSDDLKATNEWLMTKGEQDEDDEPPDGQAFVYYVLRDSRLGMDWWWLEVEVVP